MKTKTAWNIKPGDFVAVYYYPDQASPYWVEVKRISRGRATFTPRTHWRLHYTCPITGNDSWVSMYGRDSRHHNSILPSKSDKIGWKPAAA